MNVEEILKVVAPWNCLYVPEIELPALLAELSQCKSILEIGTFKGSTTAAMRLAYPKMKITTVDLPDPKTATNKHAKNGDEIGEALRFLGLQDTVHQLRMDSADLGKWPAKPFFDVVFVDGDHTFKGVRQDLQNASDFGAKILVHDYTTPYDSERPRWTVAVYKAVQDFLRLGTYTERRLPGWLVALDPK